MNCTCEREVETMLNSYMATHAYSLELHLQLNFFECMNKRNALPLALSERNALRTSAMR